MTRVSESLIYGAVFKQADTEVTSVNFYPPELTPKTSALNNWVEVVIELTEQPTAKNDWYARGLIKMFIQARRSIGNIYSARAIAESISSAFDKAVLVIVTDNISATVGNMTFTEPVSRSMGEADGIIYHYWQIEFSVFPASS